MRQKEKNIEAEAKAGIQKKYVPVGLSLVAKESEAKNTNTGASAIRLSMRTGSLRASNSLQPHTLTNYGMKSNQHHVARSQEASPEVGRKTGLKSDQVASEEIVTFDGEQLQDPHQPPVIRTTL